MAVAAEKTGKSLLVVPHLYGVIRPSVIGQKTVSTAVRRRSLRPSLRIVLPIAALPRPVRATAIDRA